MLACAGLSEGLRLLSLVALIPFLARASNSTARSAIRLGLMLAFAHHLATFSGESSLPAIWLVARALGVAAFFVLMAVLVSISRRRLGLIPTLIPLQWMALEALFMRLGYSEHLIPVSSPSLHGVGALLGTTMVSFVIVLVNSMALYAAECIASLVADEPNDFAEVSERRIVAKRSGRIESIRVGACSIRGPP